MRSQGDGSVRSKEKNPRNGGFRGCASHLDCHTIKGLEMVGLLGDGMDRFDQEKIGRFDHIGWQDAFLELSRDATIAAARRL